MHMKYLAQGVAHDKHLINDSLFLVNFIYFCLCWVFVAVQGLSLVVVSRGYSSLWCVDFSLHGLLLVVASLVVEHGI